MNRTPLASEMIPAAPSDDNPEQDISLPWDDDQQVERARPMFIAEILQAMDGFGPEQLRQVRRFIQIQRHMAGCTTPAEDLITRLVRHYDHGITPGDLEDELDRTNLDSFVFNFERALRDAKRFQRMYADEMAGGAEVGAAGHRAYEKAPR